MEIKVIREQSFDIVIEFLNNNFSSPTHWPEWNLLICDYYKTNFYYLGLFEKDKIIGICPLHEFKSGVNKNLVSGQFHFIPNGGWILSERREINFYKLPVTLNTRFECFSLPLLEDFKIKYFKTDKLYSTLVVDLLKEENDIWSDSINTKRRNMIRKSIKSEIKVSIGSKYIHDFYRLYSENNQYYANKGLPLSFFNELIDRSNHIKFTPFIAYHNEKPLAGLGLIHDKNYAFYWLGVIKKGELNMGQGDILQWEAIRYSKAHGCKYYDLCYIEKERLPNIYEFKKGFSRTEISIAYMQRKGIFYKIMNKIKK